MMALNKSDVAKTGHGNLTDGETPRNCALLWSLGSIAFFIVLANGILCFVFAFRRNLRTITNTFVLSLCVSDICVGLFTIPLLINGFLNPRYWYVGAAASVFNLLTAFCSICAITWDRYLCISKPMQYPILMTPKYATRVLLAVWLGPVPLTILIQLLAIKSPGSIAFKATVGFFDAVILLSSLLVCFANFRVLKEARKHVRAIQKQIRSVSVTMRMGAPKQTSSGRDRKATKTCAVIVCSFIICWVPTLTYDLFSIFNYRHPVANVCTLFIALLNSLVDPLIYSFRRTDFRREIIRMLTKNNNFSYGTSSTNNPNSYAAVKKENTINGLTTRTERSFMSSSSSKKSSQPSL